MDTFGWLPIRWLVFAHVLSAIAFLLVHGTSVAAMLMLARTRHPEGARALLEMSRHSRGPMWIAWASLGATGALLALAQHAWRQEWVWGSALVLIVVTGVMSPLAAQPFNEARHALGLPFFGHARTAGQEPMPLEEALAQIRRRAPLVLAVGVTGAVLLVWLMSYRPTF